MLPLYLIRMLVERRAMMSIEQNDLAKKIGCHPVTLGNWELRKRSPQLNDFVAWANELGYDVELVRRAR
jgi:transcriptional regulator with XRE-family HTH domain